MTDFKQLFTLLSGSFNKSYPTAPQVTLFPDSETFSASYDDDDSEEILITSFSTKNYFSKLFDIFITLHSSYSFNFTDKQEDKRINAIKFIRGYLSEEYSDRVNEVLVKKLKKLQDELTYLTVDDVDKLERIEAEITEKRTYIANNKRTFEIFNDILTEKEQVDQKMINDRLIEASIDKIVKYENYIAIERSVINALQNSDVKNKELLEEGEVIEEMLDDDDIELENKIRELKISRNC